MKEHKKPYSERSDADKITSNWRKTLKLFERGEYSVCVIRAATTVELASNLMIRAKLVQGRGLPLPYVEHLMVWANGLTGKLHHLLIPLLDGTPKHTAIKSLSEQLKLVNKERNSVAHSGEFKGEKTARKVLLAARDVAQTIVQCYDAAFALPVP